MAALAAAACGLLRDRAGIDLGPDNQAEQERGDTVLDRAIYDFVDDQAAEGATT
ncbi:hypothetical protein ACQEVB_35445 [Pseudonocardia sp. CA-107938]|uniref:hypothetical protein n=1 Tax=Pseudonocardia sp. CA-107938 TaxID=3240021 RepID=UPI003D8D757F